MPARKIEKENIIAVEGKDEYNFFRALLSHENIDDVQVEDIGGKDKFKTEFSVLANSEGFYTKVKRIGFVRDAENNEASSAFQSVCNVIKSRKLPVPTQPKTVLSEGDIKVGVFIMPNNKTNGMLEDLCIQSIRDDKMTKYVDAFLDSYRPEITNTKYNASKAYLLAFLSTRVPIVNSLGIAAQAKVWNFDNPCFDEIKKFLHDLF